MKTRQLPISPDLWMRQVFGSRAALEGGVVRRRVADVDRIIGRARFERELGRRGFRAVENAGHFVVFCNREAVRPVTTPNFL